MKTKILASLTAISLGTFTIPANAGHHDDAAAWAIGGLVAGAIAGAAIASSTPAQVTYTTTVAAPPVYVETAPVVPQTVVPRVQRPAVVVQPVHRFVQPAPVVFVGPPVYAYPPPVVYPAPVVYGGYPAYPPRVVVHRLPPCRPRPDYHFHVAFGW